MHRKSYWMTAVSAILAASLVLSGCTSATKTVEFKATTIHKQKLILPSVDQILMDPLRYYVIAKNAPPGQKGSIEYFWQEMERQGLTTGIAFSVQEYKKMGRNTAKLQQYILQQKAIIRAYKKYYEENQ